MVLLNNYLNAGRLSEFISGLIDIVNKEEAEEKNWQYFLHKVFDKSYNDFVKDIKPASQEAAEEVTEEQVETTIMNSMDVLASFSL